MQKVQLPYKFNADFRHAALRCEDSVGFTQSDEEVAAVARQRPGDVALYGRTAFRRKRPYYFDASSRRRSLAFGSCRRAASSSRRSGVH